MTHLLTTVNCQQSLFESWDLMGPFPVCDEMFMGSIWAFQGSEDIVAGGKKNERAKMGDVAQEDIFWTWKTLHAQTHCRFNCI